MDPFLPVDASALALLLGTLLPSLSADSAWHAYIWQVLEKATLKSKVASADRRAQASFYGLPRSHFVANIELALFIYVILRLAYRIYASKFSVASITAFVASVSGAFVHQFKALPLRATVAAQTRRLGVDDEAAALRDIAFWNVVAAVLGFVALAIALSDAMDVVDAAGAKSGSGSGGKKKKDRSDKAGEGEKKGH